MNALKNSFTRIHLDLVTSRTVRSTLILWQRQCAESRQLGHIDMYLRNILIRKLLHSCWKRWHSAASASSALKAGAWKMWVQAAHRSRKSRLAVTCINARKVKYVCHQIFASWRNCHAQRRRAAAEELAEHAIYQKEAADQKCDMQKLQNEDLLKSFHSQLERLDQMQQTLMAPMIHGPVEVLASDVHTMAFEPFAGLMPARCGHYAVQTILNGQSTVLVLGGRDSQEWQSSALAVSLLGDRHGFSTHSGLDLDIRHVKTDSISPLSLVESAACTAGTNQTVICGGRADNHECNSIWIGRLSSNLSEEQTSMHMRGVL
eukprot:jgi/Ulvmu1/1705/UM116_0018.1